MQKTNTSSYALWNDIDMLTCRMLRVLMRIELLIVLLHVQGYNTLASTNLHYDHESKSLLHLLQSGPTNVVIMMMMMMIYCMCIYSNMGGCQHWLYLPLTK